MESYRISEYIGEFSGARSAAGFRDQTAGVRQRSSKPASTATRSDDAPANSKKPQRDLSKEQKYATAGDTIPIVFCKRASNVGGVWVQPQLLKEGSYNYTGQFLYAISQGDMVDSPLARRAFVGNRNLEYTPGITATLTHYFSSAATMAASPNSCPITGGKIFCETQAAYYIFERQKTGGWITRNPDYETFYWQIRVKTIGSGDTSNTVLVTPGTDYRAIEIETGTDRTSDYWAALGVSPSAITFYWNAVYDASFNVIGGKTVGTVTGDTAGTFGSPVANYWSTFYNANGPCIDIYETATENKQINPSNPASTGTLECVVVEQAISPVADPTSFPSSYNFTTFSDVTFLGVEGNLYDEGDNYPTTTRQLSIYYEQGVKVALYSAGTPGTIGASNQFVDLAMFLFELIKRLDPASTAAIATPIDASNLQTLATFNTNIGTHFNGIIEQSMNVVEYISTMAPFFLLSFISSNGQYSLQPLLPITAGNQIDTTALTAAATFTESDILPGSFSKAYRSADERRDIVASMVWREVDPLSIGVQRTTTVRYPATASDAPVEQFDMTDCCTSAAHATLFGKYILASRKYATHSIAFNVPLLTTSLIPTQIIKVQRQRITSTGDNRTETEWYQVTDIKHSTAGISTISATHFPVDGSSVAEISDDVVNGTFTVV